MTKYCSQAITKNIYKSNSEKSEITSQILYGENFKIISKSANWLKISSSFDNYRGFIRINNIKYVWGGKSYKGIDCSALIQLYYQYNNEYFPRDTKDQIKTKKGKKSLTKFQKGNIIYWKGHVAVCINSEKLIHAYGPMKKVIIMSTHETIERIYKTAKLKVKKITKI